MLPRFTWSDEFTEEHNLRLMHWAPSVFGGQDVDLDWAPKDHHLFVWAENELAGHVGILKREVTVGDEPVLLGGIGGVVTRPEWQGQGFATAAMRKAVDYLRDELKVEFGFIFVQAHRVSFYERMRWRVAANVVYIEQRGGRLLSPVSSMYIPCADRSWPAGDVNLKGNAW